MGICKCRVVTSLFCFQHRINVCEDCLVKEHPTCVVRTYLQWLQDNDFDPACKLCHEPLSNGQPVVRLMCHDVFHTHCLNAHVMSNFSSDTAPAGYTCPACGGKTVVPADNAMSPVAVALRSFVVQAPWSSLHRSVPQPTSSPSAAHDITTTTTTAAAATAVTATSTAPRAVAVDAPTRPGAGPPALPATTANGVPPPPLAGAAHPAAAAPLPTAPSSAFAPPRAARPGTQISASTDGVVSRKAAGATAVSIPDEEDKYGRRPANAWFAQLVGNRVPAQRAVDPNASLKRGAVLLFLLVIAVITFIEVMTRARPSGDNDPLLDPGLNPHIRTG